MDLNAYLDLEKWMKHVKHIPINNNNTEITVFIDQHTNNKSQAAYLIRKIGLFITEEFCRKVLHEHRIILKISMGGIISEKTTQ